MFYDVHMLICVSRPHSYDCKKGKKKVYAAFLDLFAAYRRIPRKNLYEDTCKK